MLSFQGVHAEILADKTAEIDVEGGRNSGKTTVLLAKVLQSVQEHPGIWWLICRYSNTETETKLRPAFIDVCRKQEVEIPTWNDSEQCYDFSNGSKVFAYGLKTQDKLSRYAKIRGTGVAGVYSDQTEELPEDFATELRALMRQQGFPHQLLFSPNPPGEDHYLNDQFPEDNSIPHRKYYQLSLYDNQHNLPANTIIGLEQAFPQTHIKHKSLILGRRGANVNGVPVYEGPFRRELHVQLVKHSLLAPLEEGFDFGKHHPCVVWRQRNAYGGVVYLGGLMGQSMHLEDFFPLVHDYRADWFGEDLEVRTCCEPPQSFGDGTSVFTSGLRMLQEYGFDPKWQPDSDRPSVRFAMVEQIAGLLRRRTVQGEALIVNSDPDRWLRLSGAGKPPVSWPFLADAFEAGYVWDENLVSQGSKEYRRAKKDGWYEHGMSCVEYLERNFGHVPYRRTGSLGRDWGVPPMRGGTWAG